MNTEFDRFARGAKRDCSGYAHH